MNITDLIVDLLRQGKSVELPGLGTFASEQQPPHHDSTKGVYYPASRTPVFTTTTKGDEAIVDALAERECVGTNVARQMWKNYMDALTDKLQRTGSHSFGNLGTLTLEADGQCRFSPQENAVLSSGDERPIEGVKVYAHESEADPFARFEESAAEAEARRRAEQAEAERAARAEQERLEAERLAAERAEQERLEAERAARAEQERLEAERLAAERAEQERLEAERAARAEQERLETERLEAERAEQERLETERRAEAERMAALAALEASTATAATPSDKVRKDKKKEKENRQEVGESKNGDKKKRRGGWLWLLLLLLLLLLAAGACYYYFKIYKPAHVVETVVSETGHLEGVPVVGGLTYNTDMLEYSQRDIYSERDELCRYLVDYLYSFLAYRHYTGAQVPMMERVRQYAGDRLGTLLADRFAVQRLYPQGDYVYNHCESFMHNRFARKQRHVVQSELLDMKLLDSLLNALVKEMGLKPDAAPQAQVVVAAPVQQPSAVVAAPAETSTRVNMEQESRQGFDIIAGFYLDRAKAARMTARLHDLGSDAYIIEKNNMYYVSMGSAKNRTAAEALFKHIKSWYDGDVAIKQW